MVLEAAAGLFALYMLARQVPLAAGALRARDGEGHRTGRAIIPILNVVLALAILVVAVKGLAGALIRR
jgi:hypothetical protein